MPTGYTHRIANGTETSLRQFALRCARGMGALITMRDDPSDAPIPTELAPSLYHAERLSGVKAEIARLEALTPAQRATAAGEDHAQHHRQWAESREQNRQQYDRYTAMLDQLNEPHDWPEGLLSLMRSQIEESRRFDCWTDEDRAKYHPEPQPASAGQWLSDKLERLYKDVAYHTAEHQKELDRTAERNAWLAQLHTALKGLPE